jgi:sugar lactone lactonase YvrE
VAGNGKAGFSGDGGPATQAKLQFPLDLAFDAAGSLFLDDHGNMCIRRLGPDGVISTVAGVGGRSGFSGDNGPANHALMTPPHGLVFDAAGNLFFSDSSNHRVRKVDTSGIVSTVVGGGAPADGLGDGGPAIAARMMYPDGLAIDSSGNLFIADAGQQRVRKVDPAGIITTVAGGGHPADGRGDGGPATNAQLAIPLSLALDAAANLYIIDFGDSRVRRVGPDAKITTVAGGGNPSSGVGDSGLATDARLEGPSRAVVDPGGNLFVAEQYGERIRKVSPAGIISTVAGTGQPGRTGDSGLATAGAINSPAGLCLDRAGNLYFSEGDRIKVHPGARFANGFANVDALFAAVDDVKDGNNLVREAIGVAVPR